MRILIIEDSGPLRRALLAIADHYRFQVEVAVNLAEAQNHLEENAGGFDVVVSDIQLPDGNSPELHAKVAGLLERHLIGWVAMTAASSGSSREYYESRQITVLTKPFSPEDFRAAVRAAYRRSSC